MVLPHFLLADTGHYFAEDEIVTFALLIHTIAQAGGFEFPD
jgi:hypothetical protein